jgi:hypothetical protein
MNRDNKILLSLLPYDKEELKLKLLHDNASFKEVIRALKYFKVERIDERVRDIKKYNTVFCDERDYPRVLNYLRIPPMRLQSTASFLKQDNYMIGLVSLGNKFSSDNYFEDFALNAARNDIKTMCMDNFGLSLNRFALPSFAILSSGLDINQSKLFYTTLLSAYEPKEMATIKSRNSMYDVFAMLCNSVVLFDVENLFNINKIVNSSLDCGTDLYLSRYNIHCNVNNKSLSLLFNGTPIVSSLCDIDGFEYDYSTHSIINNNFKQR